jgi:4-amino-4-deoxy-L-arabinose transferase-like glycosyltransferase
VPEANGHGLWVRHRALVLGALGVLVYVAWLGMRDFWYPGEPDLAEVLRAMFISRDWADWVVPRRNGVVFLNYPPMHYWAASLSSQLLGGMSEFAVRLPGALAATGLVVATGAVAARWIDARAGLWAGLLLLTSSQFSFQAIGYRPDMLFSLFVGLGMFAYAQGAGDRPRWALRVAGFALLGLAVLVKGPLGLALPGLVLALWHAARREWRRLVELAPLALVSVAVVLPWYVAVAKALGVEAVMAEVSWHSVGRFASGERGHARPPFYYLLNFWVDFAPWALLFPFALVWIHRTGRWRERHVQLALWWFGTFFVFLSIAATKRQAYLMPAYPAVALLLAQWLSAVGREPAAPDSPEPRPAVIFASGVSVALLVGAVVALVAGLVLGPIVARFELDAPLDEIMLGLRLPLLALGAIGGPLVWFWIRPAQQGGDPQTALLRLALVQCGLFLVFVAWIMPALNPANSYAAPLRWIGEQIGTETHIGYLGSKRKIGAFGYYTESLVELVQDEDEVRRFFQQHPDSVVVAEERYAGALFDGEGIDWRTYAVREIDAARRHYVVLGMREAER